MTVVLLVTGWLAAGAVLALLVCGGIRIADEREGLVPARLDPRAGQHASRATHSAFTALLVALVLVGIGAAQHTFGGAA